ncbi:MAG TPA: hypothetical protein VNM91_12770, partial [Dehalococcoidia bacterium]|nr:hypothetical protein [Dehalococcoidia bacterium]
PRLEAGPLGLPPVTRRLVLTHAQGGRRMPVPVDYELTVREAERQLREARTADDVRNIWRRHIAAIGHRTLGRLLLGRPASEVVAKRDREGA